MKWLPLLLLGLLSRLSTVQLAQAAMDPTACLAQGFAPQTFHQSIVLNGVSVAYTATAQFLPLADAQGNLHACIYSTTYTKDQVSSLTARPLSFLFNGGPGYSSGMVHLGGFGPLTLHMDADGTQIPQSVSLTANQATLLQSSDLVFVDPAGTGYTFLPAGVNLTDFKGVYKDADSLGDFIMDYLQQFQRQSSPIYIIGESYSGIRVPVMANYLQTAHQFAVAGLVLVSPYLDAIAGSSDFGNNLPATTALASYATAAWYYKKIAPQYQKLSVEEVYQKAKNFANLAYTEAVTVADALDVKKKTAIAAQLEAFTGIPAATWVSSNLKVDPLDFPSTLLADQKLLLSSYDTRVNQPMSADVDDQPDPLLSQIKPLFDSVEVTLFNQLFKIPTSLTYTDSYNVWGSDPFAWATDNPGQTWSGGYEGGMQDLQAVLQSVPKLKVYIASGLFDEACPTSQVEYMVNHLPPSELSQVHVSHYMAGHIIYLGTGNATKLHDELATFVQ